MYTIKETSLLNCLVISVSCNQAKKSRFIFVVFAREGNQNFFLTLREELTGRSGLKNGFRSSIVCCKNVLLKQQSVRSDLFLYIFFIIFRVRVEGRGGYCQYLVDLTHL